MKLSLITLFASFILPSLASAKNLEQIVALQQAQIARQQAQIAQLITDSQTLKTDITGCKTSDTKQKWAEGSLCILANGTCPAGFTRQEAYIRGISIYQDNSNSSSYLTPAQFGSSTIGWHGGAPYRYGTWAGDLNLQTCCK